MQEKNKIIVSNDNRKSDFFNMIFLNHEGIIIQIKLDNSIKTCNFVVEVAVKSYYPE